jgi:hypothetical protein
VLRADAVPEIADGAERQEAEHDAQAKPKSPTRLTRNAFFAASRAAGFS